MRKLTPEQLAEIKLKADRAAARSANPAPINGTTSNTNGSAAAADAASALIASIITQDQIDAEIGRLAALPESVYESERIEAAKKIGYRLKYLDQIVACKRPQKQVPGTGAGITLAHRVHADSPIEGSKLLADIVEQISTFIFLPENEKVAVALWIVASHAFDAFFYFPALALEVSDCGLRQVHAARYYRVSGQQAAYPQ
jgi:hypothetical protein